MNRYFVLRYQEDRYLDMGIPGLRGDNRIAFWAQQRDSNTWNDPNNTMYMCQDHASAETLAKYLASTNPGVQFGVVEVGEIYQSKPGPVVGSKYTKEGLLPI